MADNYIVLPGDISGKKIRTRTKIDNGERVEDFVFVLSGDGENTAHVHENSLATTSMRHCKVSEGKLFFASKVWEDLADNGLATCLVKCHADYCVVVYFEFNSEGAAIIELFETPTITDDGTVITPRNMNRNFSDTLNTSTYHTPTISSDETLLKQISIGSGKGGSGSGEAIHWHLKHGLNYYIKLKNVAGQAKTVSCAVKFFETTSDC